MVEEYDFNKPPIQRIDSLTNKSIGDWYKKYLHTFDHICVYDTNFTNYANNETVDLTYSDKIMGLFELIKN